MTPHAQIRSRTKEAVSWQTSSAMVCGGGGEVTRLMPEVERERMRGRETLETSKTRERGLK